MSFFFALVQMGTVQESEFSYRVCTAGLVQSSFSTSRWTAKECVRCRCFWWAFTNALSRLKICCCNRILYDMRLICTLLRSTCTPIYSGCAFIINLFATIWLHHWNICSRIWTLQSALSSSIIANIKLVLRTFPSSPLFIRVERYLDAFINCSPFLFDMIFSEMRY